MAGQDQQPEDSSDDFDKAARLSFRDYPSSSLVMIAALASGLGWMLYKWRDRRRVGQPPVPGDAGEAKDNVRKADPPVQGSP